MFTEINFGPFATNVLDSLERTDLCTPTGQRVQITHSPRGFSCYIDGAPVGECLDNVGVSYALNRHQVGCYRRLQNGAKIRTIPGGSRRLEAWSGTIIDAQPVAGTAGYRYDVLPDTNYPSPRPLPPGATVHLYSGEFVEVRP